MIKFLRNIKLEMPTSSMIGDCVYKICQKLERQPSHKVILEMMPERFRTELSLQDCNSQFFSNLQYQYIVH